MHQQINQLLPTDESTVEGINTANENQLHDDDKQLELNPSVGLVSVEPKIIPLNQAVFAFEGNGSAL
jgi:hypothetical protein